MTGECPAIDLLADLVGWHGATSYAPDWPSLRKTFGRPFPTDFRCYVERFPPGALGLVQVFHPEEADWRGHPTSYVAQLSWRNESANVVGRRQGRFGTRSGDLLAWGTVNGEFELCWELTDQPAETWGCRIVDIRCDEAEHYPGGMADLLLDALSGTGRIHLLDHLRELPPPRFEPYA
ncbi:hypothetical protein GA0070213_104342 [Micromonospora humi]|uniref:Uncharacterized protein n=2 Tax=Micromonospora humi TaxID=745366 RepID=A0A1C5I336_9ACTN|nr:hypothetical protein GA0070213_104342 [Micromonospora humi]